MKKTLKKLQTNMSVNIIGAIIILLFIFGNIVSAIGFISFTTSFMDEYTETSYHMADTAATLVNGDSLAGYVLHGENAEYKRTQRYLDLYCDKMDLSLVYVIMVNQRDYGSFVSVFNLVDNTVDGTDYTPWELGYRRDTTNDEYREKYRAIYDKRSTHESVYRPHPTGGLHPHITTMVPISKSNGDVAGILCLQRPISEMNAARIPYLWRIGISTLIASVLASVLAAGFVRKRIMKPIIAVSEETDRFARENTRGESLGDISRYNEISRLVQSIDTMEEEMLRYIDNLTSATAERERISAELSIASTIQENVIPNKFPAFPDREDFDIFASMTPAKEVGGDLYNFFLIDEDHLAVTIADVSGKSVPAALFMMVTNILIREITPVVSSPGEALTRINQKLSQHNRANMFVTVWLGILEISTGKLTMANAGHNPPVVCRRDGTVEYIKAKRGLVVGAMEDIRYQNTEMQLSPGDKLFLYTDGLNEATDKDENMFGDERVLQALDKFKAETPERLLNGVKDCVDAFVGDAPQFDDLTMVCVELKESAAPDTVVLDAVVGNADEAIDFVNSVLQKHGGAGKATMKIDLSVEEIFVNIANYAYGDSTGKVELSASVDDGELTIVFKDSGTPFDPLDRADPDVTLSAEERNIGGLGIYLVKKNMDEVFYEYQNGQNILTIKKQIQ